MKSPAYPFLSLVSLIAIGAAGFVGACSGEVTEVTGGSSGATTTGGSGGAGGATMSTGQVGTSVVATSVVGTTGADMGSSTASTGGNDCEVACAKATMCGLDLCTQFNIDCAMPNPMFACPEQCIAAASCDDIQKLANQQFNTPLGMCLIGCQGMGPGGTGGPGSSGATGGAMACGQCLGQSCGMALQACAQDAGPNSTHCAKWLQCENQCYTQNPTPQCFIDCDNATPGAAGKYQPVYDCACTSCTSECGASDPCSHTGGTSSSAVSSGSGPSSSAATSGASSSASTGGGGTPQQCTQCTLQQCGQAVQACFGNNTCNQWINCAQNCNGDVACTHACDMTFAGAAALYKPIYTCECNNCLGQCGGPVDPCNH